MRNNKSAFYRGSRELRLESSHISEQYQSGYMQYREVLRIETYLFQIPIPFLVRMKLQMVENNENQPFQVYDISKNKWYFKPKLKFQEKHQFHA